jgi:hypothetical protein
MPRQSRLFGDLVSRTLDSVVNGVSQQPPTVRLPSQCEEQINLHSKVSDGATRRPPTEYVTQLTADAEPTAGYFSHLRHRDTDIQHLVLVEDGDIRVWNILTGVEATVNGLAVRGFLSESATTFTDQTTEANEATADDMDLLPAAAADTGCYFGALSPFEEIKLVLGTPGVGTYVIAWEYRDSASSWASLSVTDASGSFKNAAATYSITFTAPTAWTRTTEEGVEGFWVRAKYSSGTVTTPPTGTKATFVYKSYLDITGSSAQNAFAAISVADYTFIVNKETTVAMSGQTTAARVNEFMIHGLESFYEFGTAGRTWSHVIGGDDADTTLTGAGEGNGDSPGIFVNRLLTVIYTVGNYGANWTFENLGTVMHGYQTSGTVEDIGTPQFEWSDAIYSYIGPTAQRFSDLPSRAPADFITEITGGDGNEDNNYFVKYDSETSAWVETVAPAQDDTLAAETMPHTLIQTGIATGVSGEDEFTFGPVAWVDRSAGSTETAPEPGFVGETITDLVFHKNRLGICSGENVTLSEAGQYFNFWPTTVTTIVDSDPINAAGTNNRVGIIDYAVPFDEKLYFFSSLGGFQNVLRAAGNAEKGLTAANAEIVEASAFPVGSQARPVAVGQSIFYCVDRGVSTAVYEYGLADRIPDSVEVTSHIPTYLPANVVSIGACPRENIATMLSSDQSSNLYVYSWFYSGTNKIQSSWSTWEFHTSYDIIGADWINSVLYLVVQRADALHLEKMDFTTLADGGMSHRVYLDSLETLTGVYTAADNITRWTPTPSANPATYGDYRAVLSHTTWGADLGQFFDLEYESATGKLYTYGDWSAYSASVGRLSADYTYEFTRPIIKQSDQTSGQANPVTQGRLQIGIWKVLVRNSGGFEVHVSSNEIDSSEQEFAEEDYVYVYPGKIVRSSVLGAVHPKDNDTFTLDVSMEATHVKVEIQGTSHLPFTLIGAEWEGKYSTRSQRI